MGPESNERDQDYPEISTGILLVEDEELLRSLVERYLQSEGFQVYTAADGIEAVQQYREHWKMIQVVCSDCDLPKLNGFEAFQQMKAINADVKVMFASGFFKPQVIQQLRAAGVKYFVQKPYGPEEILTTIRILLGERS